MPARRRSIVLGMLGIAVLMAALESLLPADAFFVGDSGVKLIAAREVLSHPTRPFDVDPPVVEGIAFGDLRDPFFTPHGHHAHAVTSPVFPIVSAPFLFLFGLRGLAVLPIAGFVASLLGLSWMARAVHEDEHPATIWILFAMSPSFFYGLEFWEHTCAAGAAYLGTGLWLLAPTSRRRAVAGGVLIGLAIVLRPEAIWYAVALGVALPLAPERPGWTSSFHVAVGILIAPVALALFYAVHLGNPMGPHSAANVAAFDRFWPARHWSWFSMWMVPTGQAAMVVVAALVAGTAAHGSGTGRDLARHVVLVSTAALAALAAWHRLPIESWWTVFPSSLLVAMLPWKRASGSTFLAVLGLVQIACVLVTAPNDSAQWGPRYLLLATGPLALCACQMMSEVWRERRMLGRSLVVLIVLATIGVQRLAFKELRAAKQSYGALQRDLIGVADGHPVLTDVWWLDQATSASTSRPTHLFAADDLVGASALRRLAAAGVQSLIVVRSDATSTEAGLARWLDATPFHAGPSQSLGHSLTWVRLTR